ncbi:MAG TPA: cell wall-binding repeat-containing protein [Candidatus Limnocylindria bacterium]|nr:cell wall-binding repeat-containing protein [Candidatus Limnocylindria bacterium]
MAAVRTSPQRLDRILVALLAGLLLTTTAMPARVARAADGHAARAAEHLARAHGGSPADYELVHETTAAVPNGTTLWAGKFVHRRTGEVHPAYVDPARGVAGGPELRGAAMGAAAHDALAAKGDAELLEAVASALEDPANAPGTAGERTGAMMIPVGVWLGVDTSAAEAAVIAAHPELVWEGDRPIVDDLDTARRIRAELDAARAEAQAKALAQLEAEVVAHGGTVGYASSRAPLAYVDMPAQAVAELAALPSVTSLGLERTWSTNMASAGPAVQADWAGEEDFGNGVRVAVVEYHNVRNSGDLAGRVVSSYSTSGSLAYTGSGTFDHPTWVAGAIAGRGRYMGVAPGALIVSASTGGGGASVTRDRQIIAAADWAGDPSGGDADVINASIGQDTATGSEEARRYFDAFVDRGGRLAVAAAGNFTTFGHWDILSPGTAYNVLTVGGIDDRNTAGRNDDRVWYYPGSNGSNYRDVPGTAWNTHGDYNKPNVSAPAASVVTANGLGASGTSVATPIVAGIAAQIIANHPSLALRPEATRAIIMASAINHSPMPDGSINADHEGTGTASAMWANRLLTDGDGTWGGHVEGSMTAGQTVVQEVPVVLGQRMKIALAWNSRAWAGSDELLADLDLRITLPNGSVIGSYSYDNSYEWVEFAAPSSGTVRIEIRQSRFQDSSERFGLAWARWNVGEPVRIAGDDRFGTAAAVSRAHFGPGAPVAYVATGRNFPDALSGGPAAGRQGGPILLTNATSLPQVTRDELARLQPQRIVILGGTGVVSDSVAAALQAYTSQPVQRLAGADRFATAAAVAQSAFPQDVPAAFVATGRLFPDALSAGPAATVAGGPVLLTDAGTVPQATRDALAWLRPQRIFVVGGPGVVSDGVVAQLQAYTSQPVTRLWGADRYATAAAVSGAFFGSANSAYIATGGNFPDALAAVPGAGRAGAPMLLVTRTSLPAPVVNELTRLWPPRTYLIGGPGVVGDEIANSIRSLLGRP